MREAKNKAKIKGGADQRKKEKKNERGKKFTI